MNCLTFYVRPVQPNSCIQYTVAVSPDMESVPTYSYLKLAFFFYQ